MGLERIACVLQGVLSNYQTDLFLPLIDRARELTARHDSRASSEEQLSADSLKQLAGSEEKDAASLRIIADHARCATFLIGDGVLPSNEGRGYVLRKIMRRGIRHGRLLGQERPFLHEMVYAVRDEMSDAYPELKESAERIAKVVLAEEEQFARVIERGWVEFEAAMRWPSRQAKVSAISVLNNASATGLIEKYAQSNRALGFGFETELRALIGNDEYEKYDESVRIGKTTSYVKFPGNTAFDIYQTFGLPPDFMEDAARDAGIGFDWAGFEAARQEEQARARASWKGGSQKSAAPVYRELAKTEFEGYSALRVDGAKVLALVKDGVGVPELNAGDAGEVVLDATSFYADSGGQVGDVGWIYSGDHNAIVADVSGASKPVQGVWAHRVVARERIAVGDAVDTVVDGEVRAATTRNHTGTHLLHAALREVLGRHVKQAGSLVDRSRLRFDFSHFAGVAEEELREIEEIVNRQVLADTKVDTLVDVPIDVAVNEYHAMALFGEKYGDVVRVVTIGDFSTELCGGTHTRATGEIGLIKLVGEGSVSSGVRRVEAVSGMGALGEFRRDYEVARVVGQFVGQPIGSGSETNAAQALRAKISAQDEEMKKLRRELDAVRMKSAAAAAGEAQAVEVKGVKLLVQRVDGLERGPMRDLVDQMRGKLGSGVVVLGAVAADGKGSLGVSLICGVTKDLTAKVQAGKIVGQLAAMVGGKGGGRPDLAEAGGSDAGALDGALAKAADVVGAVMG
jgi:alanyl-tRNA synthetase